MFFDNLYGLFRLIIVGSAAYVFLIVLLRVSGNRTLSKMNAFDFVITVALGSTLATILLSDQVALLEGMLALVLLVGLQYSVTWISVRSSTFSNLIKTTPILLYFDVQILQGAMRRARVTEAELLAAVRGQGIGAMETVRAIVLEADGTFTVITGDDGHASSLRGVSSTGTTIFGSPQLFETTPSTNRR